MSEVYLDVGASVAFSGACRDTGRSLASLAGEARTALIAGQLDVGAADLADNLAELLDLLSRSVDEITDIAQAADALDLFGLNGATRYAPELEALLGTIGAGLPFLMRGQKLTDLLVGDPDKLVEEWPNLSEEERKEIAVGLTAQETELPEQKELALLVNTWKNDLGSEDLENFYFEVAATKAGIDLSEWDPSKGFEENAEIVDKVYAYYGELFASDPEKYVWAGMAALIGPSFVAGMKQLPEIADALSNPKFMAALESMGVAPPDNTAFGLEFTAEELRWYESKFLSMQREIFFDMAAKHEALLDGGADQVERMMAHEKGEFKDMTVQAFRDMENGVRLNEAGKTLLLREQKLIINDDWNDMRLRQPYGYHLTYAMTMLGQSSIPGSTTFADNFPLTIEVETSAESAPEWWQPGPTIDVDARLRVETPFPAGNISIFDHRWALIEADTLPKYLELLENDPDRAVDLATQSALERSEDYVIDVPAVFEAFTKWDAELEVKVDVGWQWGILPYIPQLLTDYVLGMAGVGAVAVDAAGDVGAAVIDAAGDVGEVVLGTAGDVVDGVGDVLGGIVGR